MEDKIRDIMASVFGIDPAKINSNTSSENLEGWDSLKSINLVTALEEGFDIRFEEEDIVNMLDYKMICLMVAEKLKINHR